MIGVVLEPVDVLHGRWVQKYKGRLTVEFIGGGEGSSPDLVKELRANLPEGQAIWFLRLSQVVEKIRQVK